MTNTKGFTLLELLIVITIISVLSVALIVVINPAETLKKARDTQRISDLSSLKTAIGIYTTSITSPTLGVTDANPAVTGSNASCQAGTDGWTGETGTGRIHYSSTTAITDTSLDNQATMNAPLGATTPDTPAHVKTTLALATVVDGTGWLPINFGAITGGSPISNLPIDPVNTVTAVSAVVLADLVYRYACHSDNLTYEINARLESAAYGITATGADNKSATDGGNNANMFEIGTKLDILGAGDTHPF